LKKNSKFSKNQKTLEIVWKAHKTKKFKKKFKKFKCELFQFFLVLCACWAICCIFDFLKISKFFKIPTHHALQNRYSRTVSDVLCL
jgi:hypothetical protein